MKEPWCARLGGILSPAATCAHLHTGIHSCTQFNIGRRAAKAAAERAAKEAAEAAQMKPAASKANMPDKTDPAKVKEFFMAEMSAGQDALEAGVCCATCIRVGCWYVWAPCYTYIISGAQTSPTWVGILAETYTDVACMCI